jgi:hypothetical protein
MKKRVETQYMTNTRNRPVGFDSMACMFDDKDKFWYAAQVLFPTWSVYEDDRQFESEFARMEEWLKGKYDETVKAKLAKEVAKAEAEARARKKAERKAKREEAKAKREAAKAKKGKARK